jgi:alkyl hydroperoxide reductase subunit D
MSLQDLRDALPDFAKDLKLNLGSLANETVLDDQKKWGTFLASAHGAANPDVVAAIEAEAADTLSAEAAEAARAAAAVMGMNNVYYRFTHLVGNEAYRSLPARLRMNAMANPGVDRADFELWSMAVSAINGCGMCMTAHEKELEKAGVTAEQIQAAVRIGAVVNAVSKVLAARTQPA